MRILASLLLGFVIVRAGTAVAEAIDPTVFGSCFEGGCGYAAMLVALLGTLVLTPLLWFALARAGPVSQLLLGILRFVLIGHFILPLWPRNALTNCVRCRTTRSRVRNTMPAACCSSLLTATKRMPGRCTASQIASASTTSFLCRSRTA